MLHKGAALVFQAKLLLYPSVVIPQGTANEVIGQRHTPDLTASLCSLTNSKAWLCCATLLHISELPLWLLAQPQVPQ